MPPTLQAQAEERLMLALHFLYVAMDSEADPRRRGAQMDAILSVQKAIDRLAEAKGVAEPPTRPIESYAPKPTVSSDAVLECLPEGRWLYSEEIEELVDWTRWSPTPYGRAVDVVHRLNHLAYKGLVERDPPADPRRRSHHTRWRRIE